MIHITFNFFIKLIFKYLNYIKKMSSNELDEKINNLIDNDDTENFYSLISEILEENKDYSSELDNNLNEIFMIISDDLNESTQEKKLPFICLFFEILISENIDFSNLLEKTFSIITQNDINSDENIKRIINICSNASIKKKDLFNKLVQFSKNRIEYLYIIFSLAGFKDIIIDNLSDNWELIITLLDNSEIKSNSNNIKNILKCLELLINLAADKFRPYASSALYQALDYLTETDTELQKRSLMIIYSLTKYCDEQLQPLSENIIDFLKVLQNGNNIEINNLCNTMLKHFMGENEEENENEENIHNEEEDDDDKVIDLDNGNNNENEDNKMDDKNEELNKQQNRENEEIYEGENDKNINYEEKEVAEEAEEQEDTQNKYIQEEREEKEEIEEKEEKEEKEEVLEEKIRYEKPKNKYEKEVRSNQNKNNYNYKNENNDEDNENENEQEENKYDYTKRNKEDEKEKENNERNNNRDNADNSNNNENNLNNIDINAIIRKIKDLSDKQIIILDSIEQYKRDTKRIINQKKLKIQSLEAKIEELQEKIRIEKNKKRNKQNKTNYQMKRKNVNKNNDYDDEDGKYNYDY